MTSVSQDTTANSDELSTSIQHFRRTLNRAEDYLKTKEFFEGSRGRGELENRVQICFGMDFQSWNVHLFIGEDRWHFHNNLNNSINT